MWVWGLVLGVANNVRTSHAPPAVYATIGFRQWAYTIHKLWSFLLDFICTHYKMVKMQIVWTKQQRPKNDWYLCFLSMFKHSTNFMLLCWLSQIKNSILDVIIHTIEPPHSRIRHCVENLSAWCDSSRKVRPISHSECMGMWLNHYPPRHSFHKSWSQYCMAAKMKMFDAILVVFAKVASSWAIDSIFLAVLIVVFVCC